MKYNFSGFTEKANEALNLAISGAQSLGHTYVGSEHLLLGILRVGSGVACVLLNKNGVTAENLENQLKITVGSGTPTRLSADYFTPRAKRVIEVAVTGCRNMGKKLVGTEHLLIGILSEGDNFAVRFLNELSVDTSALMAQALKAAGIDTETAPRDGGYGSDKKETSGKTPTLEKFGRDLTAEAKKGKIDPVIGRQKEIERVIQILCRRTKNNPCLIGEPGVGKTAVIEGLADKISRGEVPEILLEKRLFALDLTSMVAGTKYRGDFEERIKTVIEEVTKAGDVILFIDEVHTIMGAGSAEGATDAANILKPTLARGEFQLIGATTISEYRKNIEKDSALERRFQPVIVEEPNEEDSILILKGLRDRYEAHHRVKITDDAIEAAVKLSSRYVSDRFLPDKAIDLIDEASSRVRLAASVKPEGEKELESEAAALKEELDAVIAAQEYERAAELRDKREKVAEKQKKLREEWEQKNAHISGEVTAEDIAALVAASTGIPVDKLRETESEKLLKLEEVLHKKIIGQNAAVTAVSKAIRSGRVGLKDPKRPIGSFIFLGPTGVGKTQLVKALAETMFGSENMMIRLDMSEYMEKHSVSKLVGSPPGYVGFEEGGQLTEKVRRHPYSVILFDEIEKAHPDVFNMLLQILDDGILTDSQGRTVNFKNTVIIMTSNLGAEKITEKRISFGFGDASDSEINVNDAVIGELKKAFRPEFLNRVDGVIVFEKLTREEISQIARNELEGLKIRLENLNITAEFSPQLIELLSEKGYDPVYGARPLKRVIQAELEDALSEKILEHTINNGDNILCDAKDGNVVFSVNN